MALAEVSELKSPVKSWVPAKKQLLIGGKWVDAKNGKTFDVENPATGDIVAQVADGKKEDIGEKEEEIPQFIEKKIKSA